MKKIITNKIFITLLSFILLMAPIFVFAQIKNPLGDNTDIPTFVADVLKYVVRIGVIVAILAFIWVGFLFVKAQGNQTEVTNARNAFVNVCIGVAVLLGAQLIASILVGTINTVTK